MAGYSPRGREESDITEVTQHARRHKANGKWSPWPLGVTRFVAPLLSLQVALRIALVLQKLRLGCDTKQSTEKSRLRDDQAEKAMAPHSSALAWKIPWMEEPGSLQPMGSLKVGHN